MKYLTKIVTIALVLFFLTGSLYSKGQSDEDGYESSGLPGLEGMIREMQDDYELIDVRTPAEYETGFIPTAKNIPLNELAERSSEIDLDKRIFLYCRSGNRSGQAAQILKDAGFIDVTNYGGIGNWEGELEKP